VRLFLWSRRAPLTQLNIKSVSPAHPSSPSPPPSPTPTAYTASEADRDDDPVPPPWSAGVEVPYGRIGAASDSFAVTKGEVALLAGGRGYRGALYNDLYVLPNGTGAWHSMLLLACWKCFAPAALLCRTGSVGRGEGRVAGVHTS
jgi:hypothetical protein